MTDGEFTRVEIKVVNYMCMKIEEECKLANAAWANRRGVSGFGLRYKFFNLRHG